MKQTAQQTPLEFTKWQIQEITKMRDAAKADGLAPKVRHCNRILKELNASLKLLTP